MLTGFSDVYSRNILGLKERIFLHPLESWTESMQKWGIFAPLSKANPNGKMKTYCSHAQRSSVWTQLVLFVHCARVAATALVLSLVNIFFCSKWLKEPQMSPERLGITLDATLLLWQWLQAMGIFKELIQRPGQRLAAPTIQQRAWGIKLASRHCSRERKLQACRMWWSTAS